jgi:hypothetical protein
MGAALPQIMAAGQIIMKTGCRGRHPLRFAVNLIGIL